MTNEELIQLLEELKTLSRETEVDGEIVSIDEQITALREKLGNYDNYRDGVASGVAFRRNNLTSSLSALEKDSMELTDELSAKEKELANTQIRLEENEKGLAMYNDAIQRIENDYRNNLITAAQLERKQNERAAYASANESLHSEIQNLNDEIATIQNNISSKNNEVEEARNRLNEFEERVAANPDVNFNMVMADERKVSELEDTREELLTNEQSKIRTDNEINDAIANINNGTYTLATFANSNANIESSNNKIANLNSQIEKLDIELSRIQNARARKAELEANDSNYNSVAADWDLRIAELEADRDKYSVEGLKRENDRLRQQIIASNDDVEIANLNRKIEANIEKMINGFTEQEKQQYQMKDEYIEKVKKYKEDNLNKLVLEDIEILSDEYETNIKEEKKKLEEDKRRIEIQQKIVLAANEYKQNMSNSFTTTVTPEPTMENETNTSLAENVNTVNDINDLIDKLRELNPNVEIEYNIDTEFIETSVPVTSLILPKGFEAVNDNENSYITNKNAISEGAYIVLPVFALSKNLSNTDSLSSGDEQEDLSNNQASDVTDDSNNQNLSTDDIEAQRQENWMNAYGEQTMNDEALTNLEKDGTYRLKGREEITDSVYKIENNANNMISVKSYTPASDELKNKAKEKGILTKFKEKFKNTNFGDAWKKVTAAVLVLATVASVAAGVNVYNKSKENNTNDDNNPNIEFDSGLDPNVGFPTDGIVQVDNTGNILDSNEDMALSDNSNLTVNELENESTPILYDLKSMSANEIIEKINAGEDLSSSIAQYTDDELIHIIMKGINGVELRKSLLGDRFGSVQSAIDEMFKVSSVSSQETNENNQINENQTNPTVGEPTNDGFVDHPEYGKVIDSKIEYTNVNTDQHVISQETNKTGGDILFETEEEISKSETLPEGYTEEENVSENQTNNENTEDNSEKLEAGNGEVNNTNTPENPETNSTQNNDENNNELGNPTDGQVTEVITQNNSEQENPIEGLPVDTTAQTDTYEVVGEEVNIPEIPGYTYDIETGQWIQNEFLENLNQMDEAAQGKTLG